MNMTGPYPRSESGGVPHRIADVQVNLGTNSERSSAMVLSRFNVVMVLALGSLATCLCSGCQTTMGGQTLPSAYYLRDDIQYFPHGPEFKLSETVKAHEEYRASQTGLAEALATP